MKTPSRLLRALPPVLGFLLGGCAHVAPPPSASGEKVVVETETIWVTGSHIPLRVPKSATARLQPGISPLAVITPDEIRRSALLPMH